MGGSEVAMMVIFELLWIGFWFLIGVSFIAWLGVAALIVTLLGMAFSND